MKKIILIIVLVLMTVFRVDQIVSAKESASAYDDHGKRDPFWRLVTSDGVIIKYDEDLSVDDMLLEGIIFDSSGKSLAIINGNVVKANDKIGLFVVVEINQRNVFLTKGKENFVLELKKEE